jgi:hypothetical protein
MSGADESSATDRSLDLRAGDWVEVRAKDEILRTLDKNGRLDQLPFMPQMFEYCGRRLRVYKSAHKTCDTISNTGGRGMARAVHLEGVRCDGKSYGGCQAACLIFWKDAWLKAVDGPDGPARAGETPEAQPGQGCTEEDVGTMTRVPGHDEADPTYVCQATELIRATTPLRWWDVRQYAHDYRTRNVDARQLMEGFFYDFYFRLVNKLHGPDSRIGQLLMSAYDRFQLVRGGVPFPRKRGVIPAGEKTPAAALGLKPGDLVRVKSYEEILKTLDANNKNRGLYFDAEHVPYCGGRYRVRSLVDRIVDEKTGKMMRFKTASVVLDGVWCQACYSDRRMFCPRSIYPYWREIWLERVDESPADVEVTRLRSASAT